ncbi:hypothetical protein, partial [Streptomyces acidiscabies]|uniref:hypothetical protein n=1 Tax=Streptomyces acidiscabies TaxID=42234 RepID=UPI001EE76BBE
VVEAAFRQAPARGVVCRRLAVRRVVCRRLAVRRVVRRGSAGGRGGGRWWADRQAPSGGRPSGAARPASRLPELAAR